MEKTICCRKCGKRFEVVGNRGNMRQDYETVTCPYDHCHEPNEVLWPVDMRFFVRMIPLHM
ncbi:MAG TPA: hypothetical protein VIH72_03525 [Candidatus Acidoferrales bacterium]|jgi:hypothetical protein